MYAHDVCPKCMLALAEHTENAKDAYHPAKANNCNLDGTHGGVSGDD